MRLKTSIKKIIAIGLSLAMTIGMVPIWSTQALAETAQKAYEVILEPTMVYDNVYSSFENKYIVSKNSLSGVVGEDGKEILLSRKQANDVLAWDKLKEYMEISIWHSQRILHGV